MEAGGGCSTTYFCAERRLDEDWPKSRLRYWRSGSLFYVRSTALGAAAVGLRIPLHGIYVVDRESKRRFLVAPAEGVFRFRLVHPKDRSPDSAARPCNNTTSGLIE